MKRTLSLSVFAALAASVLFLACPGQRGEIKIGAILPLTGDAAVAGVNTQEGIDLAVEIINAAGGINGASVKVIYEDTQADPKTGVSAITKLVQVDKVSYVIDNSISTVTLAAAPIAEGNKAVLLATGATAPKISEAGDYIFRIWNSDVLEGTVMATYAVDSLKLTRPAILYANNDYGNGLRDVFQSSLKQRSVPVVAAEAFETGASEFRAQLAKVVAAKPDAIYLVGYSKDCLRIFGKARELGYKGIILGTTVMLDPTVTAAALKAKYKLYYPVPVSPDTLSAAVKSFRDRFQAKYQKAPPALSDVGYDAVMLFQEAVRLGGGSTGQKLQGGLTKVKAFQGASGVIEFDSYGDVHKPIAIQLAQ